MIEYPVTLTEKQMLILSAATCIAAVVSTVPKVFDTIQLDTGDHPQDPAAAFAKAMLVILDNKEEFAALVEMLNVAVAV